MDRDDNDGSADDDGTGGSSLLVVQLQVFPTAPINSIIRVKRRGVKASPGEKVSALISECALMSMKIVRHFEGQTSR